MLFLFKEIASSSGVISLAFLVIRGMVKGINDVHNMTFPPISFFVMKPFTVGTHWKTATVSTSGWKASLLLQICGPAPAGSGHNHFNSLLWPPESNEVAAANNWCWQLTTECCSSTSTITAITEEAYSSYSAFSCARPSEKKICFMWKAKVHFLFFINICIFTGNCSWNTGFYHPHPSDKI